MLICAHILFSNMSFLYSHTHIIFAKLLIMLWTLTLDYCLYLVQQANRITIQREKRPLAQTLRMSPRQASVRHNPDATAGIVQMQRILYYLKRFIIFKQKLSCFFNATRNMAHKILYLIPLFTSFFKTIYNYPLAKTHFYFAIYQQKILDS